jgi:hypothetical protein
LGEELKPVDMPLLVAAPEIVRDVHYDVNAHRRAIRFHLAHLAPIAPATVDMERCATTLEEYRLCYCEGGAKRLADQSVRHEDMTKDVLHCAGPSPGMRANKQMMPERLRESRSVPCHIIKKLPPNFLV